VSYGFPFGKCPVFLFDPCRDFEKLAPAVDTVTPFAPLLHPPIPATIPLSVARIIRSHVSEVTFWAILEDLEALRDELIPPAPSSPESSPE
jgi:hypothetical protein